ncbi:MAG: dihydropteroate synthase [Bdellovibrionota bacterium]
MNITPNSFSDGGEYDLSRLSESADAWDIGAESTAPMNAPITADEEWARLEKHLPELIKVPLLSLDTYHPETIFRMSSLRKNLIWNDVSGKFDTHVENFLSLDSSFQYVLCHNHAPTRELSGRHMDYVLGTTLDTLTDFFLKYKHPRVIFDPCLGFSKTYEENWKILENMAELQKRVRHPRWLIGFSRKSFLRKKFSLTLENREELDVKHVQVLSEVLADLHGEVWIRTHRPDLL